MARSLFLLLLLAAAPCVELTQPSSVAVKPGESVKLSCKVSGYSITSYCTHWIRQFKGKTLEWIGWICSGGNTAHKDSLKSRFSISRDTSSNMLYLQGQNLQPEDTAVYYCARQPQ
uniref:Ig-like domain-containing protein n=1 Tax=Pygocentrus nattereri TaxID=42514 RepID=A0A3B4BK10_PYGNA